MSLRLGWVVAFVAIVFAPLALATTAGGRGDLMIELSLTVGLLAYSLLCAAVLLPSRVRTIMLAFGVERVMRSHQWLAVAVLVLVLVHVVLVVVDHPANIHLLDVRTAPPRARAATGATVALVLLVVLSARRRRLGLAYQVWRRTHVLLALLAVVGTLLHVLWLNHLMRDASMRMFFALTATLLAIAAVNRWVLRPARTLLRPYVVAEIRPESPTVSTLVLRALRGPRGWVTFRPGQFAWIRTGLGEEHPFTIASGSYDWGVLVFAVKHVGDWTGALTTWRPGRWVFVDGPYGDFTVDGRARREVLLIAAGVGMTPMISMLRTLAARGDDRTICLVVGARTPDELLFRDEIAHLSRRLRLQVVEVLSAPPPEWPGLRGRVDRGLLAHVLLGGGTTVPDVDAYISGPSSMVTDTANALLELGLPAQRVHTEQFESV